MRRSLLLLGTLILIAAACLPQVELAPTRTSPGDLPQGTQALPPASTPTPIPPPTLTPMPTLDVENLDQRQGLLPAYRRDATTLEGATHYWIDIEIIMDQSSAVIEGQTRILYTNRSESRLDEVVLMLWPNNEQYAASMVVGAAVIQGQVVEGTVIPGSPGLRFDLPRSIGPEEAVDLNLPFRLEIEPITALSPKRMGITAGVLLAPTFYPSSPG